MNMNSSRSAIALIPSTPNKVQIDHVQEMKIKINKQNFNLGYYNTGSKTPMKSDLEIEKET